MVEPGGPDHDAAMDQPALQSPRRIGTFSLLAAGAIAVAAYPLWAGHPAALAGGFLAGGVAGAGVAWALRPRRQQEVAAITAAAQRLAAGDLTGGFEANGSRELAGLSQALEELREAMFKVIARVRAGTASVASTSGILGSDNAALAERTESQASSLEETASAMEQLAATVRQNAEHAREVSAMMGRTKDSAARGSTVVSELVGGMAAIKDRSSRVAEIISVIDGIAFQTNILALNAAVEAARAGEEGRGFAVVAGEVRALAQRVAAASREVRTLITDSVQQVEAGSRLAGDAGQAMDEILASVTRVSGLTSEIAAATAEQSVGIEEINRAVLQIDGSTQQNAALVQDIARTAAGLQEEAEQLTAAVGGFVLGEREFGNADEAAAMVRAAVAFLQAHGRDALVGEVNKLLAGRFIDRDLYLSVYSLDGVVAAHGTNRRLWNIDWTKFKDADGRLFIADLMAVARRSGHGWIDYKWVHPVTKQVLVKTAYFELCGDVVIACGFYKPGSASAIPRSAPARLPRLARTA